MKFIVILLITCCLLTVLPDWAAAQSPPPPELPPDPNQAPFGMSLWLAWAGAAVIGLYKVFRRFR